MYVDFEELLGKTFIAVERDDDARQILFKTTTGEIYRQFHQQDCCESVYIESVVGDLEDLVGSPILMADEVISKNTNPDDRYRSNDYGTFTWTFYKLATLKGYVDIRWYGSSNGYYSERVSLELIQE